jgi:hypothetical protein
MTLHLQANGLDRVVSCQYHDTGATCAPTQTLPEGAVALTATIQDYAGNVAEAAPVTVTVDTTPPVITVAAPPYGTITNQVQQVVTGVS